MRGKLRILAIFLLLILLAQGAAVSVSGMRSDIAAVSTGVSMNLKAKSACLMEASSGEILYEQNADEKLEPASVTKIMALLLFMEALDDGVIKMDDMVTASMHAAQMGGSQIWLEYGEQFSVDDMLKAVVVVSANDCTVALAEHIAGSEEAFVARMNDRAAGLGMANTQFLNSTGLPEPGHVTTSRDIAIMTRELLKHEEIFNYTNIWMDSIRDGEMGLTNTNKLVRFYSGTNGMKTGFTSSALYCLSATAKRDGMQLISVVMKVPSSDERFADAKKLLDYGFANFSVYQIESEPLEPLKVLGGILERVEISYESREILLPKGRDKQVEKLLEVDPQVSAPVKMGQKVGVVRFAINGEEIANVDILAQTDVERIGYFGIMNKIFKKIIMFR